MLNREREIRDNNLFIYFKNNNLQDNENRSTEFINVLLSNRLMIYLFIYNYSYY